MSLELKEVHSLQERSGVIMLSFERLLIFFILILLLLYKVTVKDERVCRL